MTVAWHLHHVTQNARIQIGLPSGTGSNTGCWDLAHSQDLHEKSETLSLSSYEKTAKIDVHFPMFNTKLISIFRFLWHLGCRWKCPASRKSAAHIQMIQTFHWMSLISSFPRPLRRVDMEHIRGFPKMGVPPLMEIFRPRCTGTADGPQAACTMAGPRHPKKDGFWRTSTYICLHTYIHNHTYTYICHIPYMIISMIIYDHIEPISIHIIDGHILYGKKRLIDGSFHIQGLLSNQT